MMKKNGRLEGIIAHKSIKYTVTGETVEQL